MSQNVSAPGHEHEHHEHDADAARLASLGYTSEFRRDIGVGLIYLVLAKPCNNTDAIAGDAIPGADASPPQTPTPHV